METLKKNPLFAIAIVVLVSIYCYKGGKVDTQTLGTFVTIVIIPLIQAGVGAAQSARQRNQSQTILSKLAFSGNLLKQLQLILNTSAGEQVSKTLMEVAEHVANNEMTPREVEAKIQALVKGLKDQAVEHFEEIGIDLTDHVSDGHLESAAMQAVNAQSPFPGFDLVAKLSKPEVARSLVRDGTMRTYTNHAIDSFEPTDMFKEPGNGFATDR